MISAEPFTISDAQDAVSRYRRDRGIEPFYIVVDVDSFRSMFLPFDIAMTSQATAFSGYRRPRTAHLFGFEVVVIPTDGIPMLKVVGTPGEEAMRV